MKKTNPPHIVINSELHRSNRTENDFRINLFESAAIGLVVCDLTGKFLFANKHFCDLIGHTEEQLRQISFPDLVHPDNRELITEISDALQNTPTASYNFEERYVLRSGKTIWVNITVSVIRDKFGHAQAFSASVEDINDRKIADLKLKDSLNFIDTVIQNANVMILGLDEDFHVMIFNPKAQEQTGYTIDELQGRNLFEVFTPREVYPYVWDEIERSPNGGFPVFFECPILTKSKTERYISWRNTELQQEGDLSGYIIFGIDITERIQSEAKLQLAKERAEESERLKTTFLRNVSHEIRTPLNAVVGFSSMLTNQTLGVNKRNAYFKIIRDNGEKLIKVIEDLISLSAIENEQAEVYSTAVDVNRLIENVYSEFAEKVNAKGVEFLIEKTLDSSFPCVYADEQKLTVVLYNLISNAEKFTELGCISIGCSKNGNKLEFFVEDTGIGISGDNLQKVFENFTQANGNISSVYGGSGLGLSIAKAYVELMNGQIHLESKVGKGSRVSFFIPYKPVKQKTQKPECSKAFKTILIVQNKIDERLNDDDFFQNRNLHILYAQSAAEAMQICKFNVVHLVFIDLNLQLLTGTEVMQKIKARKSELPIIARTRDISSLNIANLMEYGFDDYIYEDADREEYNLKLERYL